MTASLTFCAYQQTGTCHATSRSSGEQTPAERPTGMARRMSILRKWRDRHKPPLHFLHIGKTGGTAIKQVLREAPAERYRAVLHPHRVLMSEIPVGQKVTFVVRDPIGRFVSGFNSRLRRGGTAHFREWSEEEGRTFRRFPSPESLALALGSDVEQDVEDATAAIASVMHLRTHQTAWVGGLDALRARQGDILLVGRQWALADDFARLADLIGLPTRQLPADPDRSHRTPPGFSTTLSDAAAAHVRAWYADDYALLAELTRLGPSVGFAGDAPPPA